MLECPKVNPDLVYPRGTEGSSPRTLYQYVTVLALSAGSIYGAKLM